MSAAVIEYRNTFRFDVGPSALWATLLDVDGYSHWWSWLKEFTVDGEALEAGSVMHGVVVPPLLPYRMRIDVEIVSSDAPREIHAVVRGDLEGTAELQLAPAPNGTIGEVAWRVEMMQAPMRIASRIAHPILEIGHDRVVDVTVGGLRRHLREISGARRKAV